MTFRSRDEIRESFELHTRVLDTGLERAMLELSHLNLRLVDGCNRSGVDNWAGYPYFDWSFDIQVDAEHEGRIRRASVELDYLEPDDLELPRDLKIRIVAEIFRRGAESDVKRHHERRVALTELSTPEAFAALIRAAIAEADAELARLR